MVICHDQEPLLYGHYTQDLLESYINWHWKTWHQAPPNPQILQYLLDIYKSDPFRIVENLNTCDRAVLLHSELNSDHVARYEQAGYVPVYYWSHALLARDWFRYAEHDPLLDDHKDNIRFLVLSRAWSGTREYRLYVLDALVKTGLVQHCVVTFSSLDNGVHYTQHAWANNKLRVSDIDLTQQGFLPASDATSSADYDSSLIQQTSLDLVLETLCDDPRLHLTEKTLRSLACGRPFLLLSGAGSLALLRHYGFETFDPLLDESYDLERDCVRRIDMVISEMSRVTALPPAQKNSLLKDLQAIALRNKKRFFSREFLQQVIDEYTNNMSLALDSIRPGARQDIITRLYQLVKACPVHGKILTADPHLSARYPRLLISKD